MRKRFARAAAAMDADRRLTFGGFSLDLASEQLLCDGEVVARRPREWRIVASAARVHGRQRRRTDAEAARIRSAALVSRLADSLPLDHELRGSFLGHRSVREVPGPRGAGPRSRRRS